jgi:hypothetical protein
MLFLPSIACNFVVLPALESPEFAHVRSSEALIGVLPEAIRSVQSAAVVYGDAEECLEGLKWEFEVAVVVETSFGDRGELSATLLSCFNAPSVSHNRIPLSLHQIVNVAVRIVGKKVENQPMCSCS